jgi:hypothetical protein
MPGTTTSKAEVTNISQHGFWLLLDDRELFLPFEEFPWFKRASVESIVELEQPRPGHLHWPELDVDLSVESIEHPERYPLKSKRLSPDSHVCLYRGSAGARSNSRGRAC